MDELRLEKRRGRPKCPYCLDLLPHAGLRCVKCSTGYHRECGDTLSACAIHGCEGRLESVEDESPSAADRMGPADRSAAPTHAGRSSGGSLLPVLAALGPVTLLGVLVALVRVYPAFWDHAANFLEDRKSRSYQLCEATNEGLLRFLSHRLSQTALAAE